MADIYTDALMIIGSYVGVILLTFFSFQFFSAGFISKWFRVKTSRGKLVLVKVKGIMQDYYRAGRIEQSFLFFKDNHKEARRIKLPRDCLYRSIGVHIVDVDDEKNAVNKLNYEAVSGFDAQKYEELYVRALYKPNVFDNKQKIVLYILIAVLLGVVIIGFLVFNQGEQITELLLKVGAPVNIPI